MASLGVAVPNVSQTSNSAIDLAKATMNSMPRGNIKRLFALRKFAVLAGLLVTPSGKLDTDPGAYGVEQRLEVADGSNARGQLLYGVSTYVKEDYLRVKIVPWVIDEVTWQFDAREIARNKSNSTQIIKLMDTEKQSKLRALVARMEAQYLGTPVNLSDRKSHTGLLFWCRGLATNKVDPIGGYNGIYAPLGDGTLTAQLSPGNNSCDASDPTNTRLRGWAATYDGTFSPLLVKTIRTAIMRSAWEAPLFIPGLMGDPERAISMLRIYWPQFLGEAYADAVNQQGHNDGGNVSPYWGDLKFGPAVTVGTPALDNIANVPILGVNHQQTKLKVISGEWFAESEAITDGDQPTVQKQLIWNQSCVDCDDVRSNFCIHTPR